MIGIPRFHVAWWSRYNSKKPDLHLRNFQQTDFSQPDEDKWLGLLDFANLDEIMYSSEEDWSGIVAALMLSSMVFSFFLAGGVVAIATRLWIPNFGLAIEKP